MKKEKEETIWRRKMFFVGNFFEGGKQNGEGKGGKYSEEKNIWSLEEKKTKKEKEETIWRKKVFCGEKQKGKIFLEGETVADL